MISITPTKLKELSIFAHANPGIVGRVCLGRYSRASCLVDFLWWKWSFKFGYWGRCLHLPNAGILQGWMQSSLPPPPGLDGLLSWLSTPHLPQRMEKVWFRRTYNRRHWKTEECGVDPISPILGLMVIAPLQKKKILKGQSWKTFKGKAEEEMNRMMAQIANENINYFQIHKVRLLAADLARK